MAKTRSNAANKKIVNSASRTKGRRSRSSPIPTSKPSTRTRSSKSESLLSSHLQVSPFPPSSPPQSPIKDQNELNSSPIKQSVSTPPPQQHAPESFLTPSPRKKKSVAFSDELLTLLPNSPDRNQTPGRSILKAVDLNQKSTNNSKFSSNEVKQAEICGGPSDPKFWLQGTIVQMSDDSPKLLELIQGCVSVLQNESFNQRFEVYATLNSIYKTNSSSYLVKYFISPLNTQSQTKSVSCIQALSSTINRDIETIEKQLFMAMHDQCVSPTKIDPFRIRTINQALKLLNFFMSDKELNNFIPMENVNWIYHHACTMLTHTKVSKALVSPYLLIVKDFKFGTKKTKLLLESNDCELAEKLLFTLINMRSFPSSSLITEKFVCFKNFTNLFPNIMAKNIGHWFPMFLLNICNIGSPFYFKCFGVGIFVLLESSRAFLDNKNVSNFIVNFLSDSIPNDVKSISGDSLLEIDTESLNAKNFKVIDIIVFKIEELISDQQYKFAMDLWIAVSLLIGESLSSIEKWDHLSKWIQITKICFNSNDLDAKLLALSSWKVMCFNLCKNNLLNLRAGLDPIIRENPTNKVQLISQFMKPKVKLITYLFTSISTSEMPNEVIFTLHNLFIAILYLIVSPSVIRQSTKYLHIYWDKIIQSVVFNFYFKKGCSSKLMHELGLKLLLKFLKPTPLNEKSFSEIRVLSNDPVQLNEINSLPTRWIHSRFDRIMQVIIPLFLSEHLRPEDKVDCFNAFLQSIKNIIKKEGSKLSPTTCDIIDNIPINLNYIFQDNAISYESIQKLIGTLNDTFHPHNLVNRAKSSEETTANVYLSIFQFCFPNISKLESLELVKSVLMTLNNEKLVIFIADFIKINKLIDEEIFSIFTETLTHRVQLDKSKYFLNSFSEICQFYKENYQPFVKNMIQQIVSINDSEEMLKCFNDLEIESWNTEIINFFLVLIKGAPNKSINEFAIKFIKKQLQSEDAFMNYVTFLTTNDFELEIFHLLDDIVERALQYKSILKPCCDHLGSYLQIKANENVNHKLIDKLCVLSHFQLGFNVLPLIKNSKNLPEFSANLNEVETSSGSKSIETEINVHSESDSLDKDMQRLTKNNTKATVMDQPAPIEESRISNEDPKAREQETIEEDTIEDEDEQGAYKQNTTTNELTASIEKIDQLNEIEKSSINKGSERGMGSPVTESNESIIVEVSKTKNFEMEVDVEEAVKISNEGGIRSVDKAASDEKLRPETSTCDRTEKFGELSGIISPHEDINDQTHVDVAEEVTKIVKEKKDEEEGHESALTNSSVTQIPTTADQSIVEDETALEDDQQKKSNPIPSNEDLLPCQNHNDEEGDSVEDDHKATDANTEEKKTEHNTNIAHPSKPRQSIPLSSNENEFQSRSDAFGSQNTTDISKTSVISEVTDSAVILNEPTGLQASQASDKVQSASNEGDTLTDGKTHDNPHSRDVDIIEKSQSVDESYLQGESNTIASAISISDDISDASQESKKTGGGRQSKRLRGKTQRFTQQKLESESQNPLTISNDSFNQIEILASTVEGKETHESISQNTDIDDPIEDTQANKENEVVRNTKRKLKNDEKQSRKRAKMTIRKSKRSSRLSTKNEKSKNMEENNSNKELIVDATSNTDGDHTYNDFETLHSAKDSLMYVPNSYQVIKSSMNEGVIIENQNESQTTIIESANSTQNLATSQNSIITSNTNIPGKLSETIHPSHNTSFNVLELIKSLSETTNEELSKLSREKRYQMETQLLQVMLKLRAVNDG